MKVLIEKASDWDYSEVTEINSLEELLKIYHSLIIESDNELNTNRLRRYNSKNNSDIDFIVTIYDDYVE